MILIDNVKLDIDMYSLLNTVKLRCSGYLNTIKRVGKNLMCTCPFHGNHNEKHPSCGVNNDPTSKHFGTFHCFACEEKGYITKFLSQCFSKNEDWVKNWLTENFSALTEDEETINLPEIVINNKKKTDIIPDSTLRSFEGFHPYMIQRKLNQKVIKEFNVRYDTKTQMLVFPVRDYNGNIVMFTRRSIKDKTFIIDKEKEKPVYLLYYWMQKGVDEFMLTEGQIDALTACSYGFPCCATMGQPSDKQIQDINKSGVRRLYLMFDNDYWGRRFTETVKAKLRKDIMVIDVRIPYKDKKDINDLSEDEFYNCIKVSEKTDKI